MARASNTLLVLLNLAVMAREVVGEEEVVLEADGTARVADTSTFGLLWATPFMVTDFRARRDSLIDVRAFNEALYAAVMASYGRCCLQYPRTGSSSRGRNEMFYQVQAQAYDEAMERVNSDLAAGQQQQQQKQEEEVPPHLFLPSLDVPEWAKLMELVQQEAVEFMQRSGRFEAAEGLAREGATQRFFCWASVHENGVGHLAHVHQGSVASTVYYVRTPPGSGSITFFDPRGPLPPFDLKRIHRPEAGQLIVFPSSLSHTVAGTFNEAASSDQDDATGSAEPEPRVSISCNINYRPYWKILADVSIEMKR